MFDCILHRANGIATVELNSAVGVFRAVSSAVMECKRNTADVVTLHIQADSTFTINIGDWIVAKGRKFYCLTRYSQYSAKKDSAGEYEISFYAPEKWFYKANRYNTTETYSGGSYSWSRYDNELVEVGTLQVLANCLCYNNNAQQQSRMFRVVTCPVTEAKVVSFSSENCEQSLYDICTAFGVRYDVTYNTTDNIFDLNFYEEGLTTPSSSDLVYPIALSYERQGGIYELELTGADEEVYTEFEVSGSSENIPSSYGHFRLQLDSTDYPGSMIRFPALYGTWGRSVKCLQYDDIKPTRTGSITGIVSGNILQFIDTTLIGSGINPLNGTINILSGALMGFSFSVSAFDSATGKITVQPLNNEPFTIPSSVHTTYQFAVGDTYNITDIELPQSYITSAENALAAAALNDADYWSSPRASYNVRISPFETKANNTEIVKNMLIRVIHNAISLDKYIRVQSVSYNLFKDTYFDVKESGFSVSDFRLESLTDAVYKQASRTKQVFTNAGINNIYAAANSSKESIVNKLAQNIGYDSFSEMISQLTDGKGIITKTTEQGQQVNIINTDLLRAGSALINSLLASQAFIDDLVVKKLYTGVDENNTYVKIEDGVSGSSVLVGNSNQYIIIKGEEVSGSVVKLLIGLYDTNNHLLASLKPGYLVFQSDDYNYCSETNASGYQTRRVDGTGVRMGSINEYGVAFYYNPNGSNIWNDQILRASFNWNGLSFKDINGDIVFAISIDANNNVRISGSGYRNHGGNSVSTLASLPTNKRLVNATLSGATNISLANALNVGDELYICCTASASFTQPLPTTGGWRSMSGSSIEVSSGDVFEISILCYNTGCYSLTVKKQDA